MTFHTCLSKQKLTFILPEWVITGDCCQRKNKTDTLNKGRTGNVFPGIIWDFENKCDRLPGGQGDWCPVEWAQCWWVEISSHFSGMGGYTLITLMQCKHSGGACFGSEHDWEGDAVNTTGAGDKLELGSWRRKSNWKLTKFKYASS